MVEVQRCRTQDLVLGRLPLGDPLTIPRRQLGPRDPLQAFEHAHEGRSLLQNAVLSGSPLHYTDSALRNELTARLTPRLQAHAYTSTVLAISGYVKWKKEMLREDKDWGKKRAAEAEELTALTARLTKTAIQPKQYPRDHNSSYNNTSSSTTKPVPASSSSTPPLTDEERQLLKDNRGCFKCRKFFAGHMKRDCPDWPTKPYKTLTAADAIAAQKRADSSKKSLKVGAVNIPEDHLSDIESDAYDSDDLDLAYNAVPVASIHVGALGTDAEDTWDSEYVPTQTSPHLLWNACITNTSSPSSSSNSPVPSLIDTGAPVNLIDEATVTTHKLRLRPLPQPMPFSAAFSGGSTVAQYWVKFTLVSPDGSYASRSCRAVVVPTLCYPIVLGVPFLTRNDLLVDLSRRALWDINHINILQPSTKPPSLPTPSPQARRTQQRERERLQDRLRVTQHRDLVQQIKLDVPMTAPEPDLPGPLPVIAAVRQRVEELAFLENLKREDASFKSQFADCFPPDIPPTHQLPSDVFHEINLKDANMTIVRRQYDCPKKYREAFKTLLTQHLEAGRLRESSSPYASPCFLVPKADPTALPRWVNDYRVLNENTIPDVHPLPSIQEILSDCARGKIWGKLDMTNSFFQTRVHPDHVKYTAITTPFGLYEWTVMPQGCRNAPSTHQCRMYQALRPYIGSICHVYLDDIIIWSQTIEEHRRNVATILSALRTNQLYCSLKKTDLFCVELNFLGHHISRDGVTPDGSKVEKILKWPTPASASDVRSFLGLVRYISNFLPHLAQHTATLNPLTSKDADKDFVWTPQHHAAFEAIKQLVVSHECLTTIDHENLGNNKIFVSTDASDFCTGAVLSYGETLDTARPVAFESAQLSGAELNYPVHEKELLVIVRALKKWRVDLLGVPFIVFTDHRTLENFNHQKHLSRRQARWQEFLGQYDFKIQYLKGSENSVADALSRLPPDSAVPDSGPPLPFPVAAMRLLRRASRSLVSLRPPIIPATPVAPVRALSAASDPAWLIRIRNGYADDRWCRRLLKTLAPESKDPLAALLAGDINGISSCGITARESLLFVGDRLCIPRVPDLRESLYRLAHDSMGHFGTDKSYALLRDSYYWPHMRRDLEKLYVPSCEKCQRNKSPNKRPRGPLHPLPVPDGRCLSLTIDFIGRLPVDNGFDCIATFTCRLNSEVRIVPCRYDMTADDFAELFFLHWYCENGLPVEIISDRDKLFMSRFWKALHRLTGVDLKMSTSYHPETDGASERTNRTVIQMLRYHVERNQTGWSRALPLIRFQIMSTPNASTGFAPFQLRNGALPRVIPPLIRTATEPVSTAFGDVGESAKALLERIETDVLEAQDNLLLAKTHQAAAANDRRDPELPYKIGDRVLLSTFHRQRDYMQRGDHRVTKFMMRYDGPYTVTSAHPETSTYVLDLPETMKIHATFHASLLRPYIESDLERFPSRAHAEPGPIMTPDGLEEYAVDRILDRRRRGRGWQYLVRWQGYGPGSDSWLPGSEVRDLAALDTFLHDNDFADPYPTSAS